MDIWKIILVVLPFFRFGISVSKRITEYEKPNATKELRNKTASGLIADLMWLALSLFILYKAGVLIINW